MLNTNGFITKIRNIIIDGTSFTKAYTPDLTQAIEDKACCVTLLTGSTSDNLCNVNEYNTLTFRVLIRGLQNDTDVRILADEVFNALHLLKNITFTNGKIINVLATSTPIYAGRDDNDRIMYNITFKANVE